MKFIKIIFNLFLFFIISSCYQQKSKIQVETKAYKEKKLAELRLKKEKEILDQIKDDESLSLNELLDDFFKRYVKVISRNQFFDSLVDYHLLDGDIKSQNDFYNNYLLIQKKFSKINYNLLNKNQKISILINSYNFFAIKLILDYFESGKLRSVFDIKNNHGVAPFSEVYFNLFDSSPINKPISLNSIENEILRPLLNYRDARIHFALICASKGCPALLDVSFQSEDLEKQLDFVTNNAFKLDRIFRLEGSKAILVELFSDSWYGIDFKNDSPKNSVLSYLNKIIPNNNIKSIEIPNDYSWDLNIYE